MNINKNYLNYKSKYLFSTLKDLAQNNKNANKKLIDLGIGDVKAPPPKSVIQAMKKACDMQGKKDTFCGYCQDFGLSELRKNVVNHFKSFNCDVQEDEVFITDGAKNSLGNVFELVNLKKVGIITPTYPLYKSLIMVNGAKCIEIKGNEKNGFCPLPPKRKVDAIFICSPSNPTGAVFSENMLKKYVDYCIKNNALLIFDRAYYCFDNSNLKSIFQLKNADKCAIEIHSYSKGFSFTGIRCGYNVIKKQNDIYNYYKQREGIRTNGVSIISQFGAIACYSQDAINYMNKMIDYYRKNALILKSVFDKFNLKCFGGQNAPYLFCEVDKNKFKNSTQFMYDLLKQENVIVSAGDGFGDENYIRICCFLSRKECYIAKKRLICFLNG